MASTRSYFDTLQSVRDLIGAPLGIDLSMAEDALRRAADADLSVVAVLAKILVDKGVCTDAELQTFLNGAAAGTDGSVWTPDSQENPPGNWAFDAFPGEGFETGANGDDATASNTAFARGPVGDSLLTANGTCRFDSSTSAVGSKSLKTVTQGPWSRGLRTDTYAAANPLYSRFYFKAAAAPASAACRIFSAQVNPDPGSGLDAEDQWTFELGVDSPSGKPFIFDNLSAVFPGGSSSICNNAWWRIELGIYGTTCELRAYTGVNLTGTTTTFSYTGSYSGKAVNSVMIGQPGSRLSTGQTWTTWHDSVAFSTSGWVGP